LQNEIAAQFPGVTAVRVRDALEAAQKIMKNIVLAVRASAAVTLLAGVLVLAGGIGAARRRHVYDAVILKTLGAEKRHILKTFLLEYAILGVVTALIAAVLGALAAKGIVSGIMDLSWTFRPLALLGATALCLAVTLLGGIAGTWRALLQKPAPYLRNQ
jgi:putative ABC transport system permease protein